MSTKVSKSNAKTTTTKTTAVRMTNEEKIADPTNYILNPTSGKMVSRATPQGKKLAKAEETGEEVPGTMTDTQRLILVIQTIQDQLGLEDSAIKAALTADSAVMAELPRSFPSIWGGKQKVARHPEHPKQPSNSYIFFTKAVRASVVEANPGVKNTEIVSIMSKQWNDTPQEDRTEYTDLAAEDKLRYEAAMKIFEEQHPEEARSKSSPANGKPTKETAYHLYCEDHRESVQSEFPDFDGKAITKKLAEMWDVLKKEDKDRVAEYQADAEHANVGFEERTKEFHESPKSSPKLSKVEQIKADDHEHYELNMGTGRYVLKEGWKKNPDGSFVKVVKKEAKKATTTEKEKVAKPAEKVRLAAKVAKAKIEKVIEEEDDDDDLLVM